MADEVQRVFVYGTLLQGGPNHARLCGDALTIQPAHTTGRLYQLPAGFPAMVEADAGVVYGEAMSFSDIGATLARLDLFEGYRPDRPELSLYVRQVQQVTLLDTGGTAAAYCYVWRGPLPAGAVLIPSGRWFPAIRL